MSAAVRRSPTWAGRAFHKVLLVVLALGVGGALLVGAILLVLAIIAIGEGDLSLFFRALAGGFVSLFFTWFLGKGVRIVRRTAHDRAVADCTEALRLDPPNPIAHNNGGFACFSKGEYAKAIAHYDAAIRLDPTLPEAYPGRVNAYGALGQYDRVIAEYTAAIQLDPNHALAYCARATAYNGLGRFYHSIPDATEAIRLAPHLYLGHDARGFGLLQRGGYGLPLAAIALLWWILTFGFLRRGAVGLKTLTTLGSKADYQQAIADFTEALRLKPSAWDCHHGRALVYWALGERARAAADEASVRVQR